MFEIESIDIMNKNLDDFFHNVKISEEFHDIINSPHNIINTEFSFIDRENVAKVYSANVTFFGEEKIFIISDITELSYSIGLLENERNSSKALFESVLPQNLAVRVIHGETNINFSVQSASIVY